MEKIELFEPWWNEDDPNVIKSRLEIEEIKSETEGDRLVSTFIASNSLLDRDRELMEVDGWDLKNYKKNPVVLWCHSMLRLPVGRCSPIKVIDKNLVSKVTFTNDDENPMGYAVGKLVKAGFLNAMSVRFLGQKWEDGDGQHGQPLRRYTKQELLEQSIVTVPAHPGALVIARGKGIIDGDEYEKLLDGHKGWVLKDFIPYEVKGAEEGEERYEKILKRVEQLVKAQDSPGEEMSIDEVLKPFPNEHSCRLQQPGAKYTRCRRVNNDRQHEGKRIDVIFCRRKSDGKTEEQAFRYPKDIWSASSARSHCKDHDGILFEPAKKEVDGESYLDDFLTGDPGPEGQKGDGDRDRDKTGGFDDLI